MRACQLCGCASWGPIGNSAETERVLPWKMHEKWIFVRCDNCNSIAREDLLQDAEFKPGGPSTSTSQPLPDFITETLARVMPVMPAPPTRLERLTVALLRSGMFEKPEGWGLSAMLTQADKPSILIEVARHLESQLDQSVTPTIDPIAKQPWLTLSFPAREEFEQWLTRFLDAVIWPGYPATQGAYSKDLYERAVSYVQQ